MTDLERDRSIKELLDFKRSLERQDKIPRTVGEAFAFRLRKTFASLDDITAVPDELASAPLAAITAPSGGATIDSEARAAVNTLITRMESLGLVLPN